MAALVVLVVVLTGLVQESFVSAGSLSNMAKWTGLYGILAVGVCFVITTGGIDLSMGSLVGLSGVLFPTLVVKLGWPVAAAVPAVVACGALVGLVHGLLITGLRLQPFLVTLCGLFVYRGLARSVGQDRVVGFGTGHTGLKEVLVRGDVLGVPVPFVILLAIAAFAALLLNRTVFGRYLLALGRNEEAARFAGVATGKMKVYAYIICSTLAAVAGMLFVLQNNSATPSTFGNFYELYAIAGAVLGGCSLRGGEGAIAGVIAGTALVQVTADAVFFLGVPETLKFTVIGLFILVGVIVDELFRRYPLRGG